MSVHHDQLASSPTSTTGHDDDASSSGRRGLAKTTGQISRSVDRATVDYNNATRQTGGTSESLWFDLGGRLDRAAADDNGVRADAGEALSAASSSSGDPLPASVQGQFESSLGADLGGVRVHTGEASANAAAAVGARAFATGNDIHFGAGHYDPSSSSGQHLLAHEVAHTVQQRGGAGMQRKPVVSSPGDAHEAEADRAADAMVSGAPFAVGSGGDGMLSRVGGGDDLRDASAAARAPAAAASTAVVADLAIHADTETADRTVLTRAELQNAQVGHSWITLKYKDPATVPDTVGEPSKTLLKGGGTAMGFWPLIRRASQWAADGSATDPDMAARIAAGQTPGGGASSNAAHTGFSLNPFTSVPGRVEEPDDAHAAKGSMSYTLTQSEVDKLLAYADGKRGANYNLYSFNCTTFAVQAVAAAGKPAPSGAKFGMVALPNELYKDILQQKVNGNAGATTTPLGADESETVPTASKR
jgi:hypothetical protein